MKYCNKCKTWKELTEFGTDRTKKDGKSTVCLTCRREYDKIRMRTKERKEYAKSDKMKAWKSAYEKTPRRRAKVRAYENEHRRNPQVRIAHNLRTKMRFIIQRPSISERTEQLIGMNRVQFLEHIQRQFIEGMTWDNYGKVWELDHIKPLSAFDLTNPDEYNVCCHYSNIRPLFIADNRKKSNAA